MTRAWGAQEKHPLSCLRSPRRAWHFASLGRTSGAQQRMRSDGLSQNMFRFTYIGGVVSGVIILGGNLP